MNELPSIFIPCETVAVRVVFAPSNTLTPLGQLVVKAIHAGVRTISDLDAIFGLGERPMLRLAVDLMNQSIVTFNFETGEMRLTPQAVAAVQNDSLKTIGSLERITEELVVMRDCVAGTVWLSHQNGNPAPSGARVPQNPDGVPEISAHDALRAIRRYMRHKISRSRRPLHALEVTFELVASAEKKEGQIQYRELRVHPLLDNAADHLKIVVESPDNLSWETRDRLERALTSLANRKNPDDVFKNLRKKASQVDEPSVKGVLQELLDLQDLVGGLEALRPGTEVQQQARLERAAGNVEGLAGKHGTKTRAEIIIGDEDHVSTTKAMIRAAKRQILIACPFVRYDATWQYRQEIEAALHRGCRVFFLLGIGDDYELPEGVKSWLYGLKDKHRERLYFSLNSARCHAKFVVADAADVLLTSYNFLDRPPGDIFELGIRLRSETADSDQDVCPVAREVVKIARQIYADHVDSLRIIEHAGILGSPRKPPPTESPMPRLPERGEKESSDFYAKRIALWKRDWRRHTEILATRVHELGATYSHVHNADHRKLMYDAIRGAKQRLAFLSDQVSSEVLNREFEDALAECTQRGAEVALVFRRRLPGAQEALERIAARCGPRLRYVLANRDEAMESHAKLVVCDDWAVVTSFNFLSFSGDYVGAERHRTRTEIGVLMQGDIVEQLWERLTAVIPQLRSLEYRPTAQQHPSVAERAVEEVPLAREIDDLFVKLLDRPSAAEGSDDERRQIGSILKEWFRDAPRWETAFAELDELAAVKVPFLEQAIAACMATQSKADEATRKRWTDRLIEEIWMNRADAHVVGLLLRNSSAGDSPSVPPPELVLLTADYRSGQANAKSFESAAVARDDAMNATAVAALAIESMLYDDDPPHDALRYIVETDLAPRLRGLSAKALAFRVEHPQGLVGVDLSRLSSNEVLVKQQEDARKQLVEELQKCIGLWPNFRLGQLVWSHLRGGEHGFDALLGAAERSNVRSIARFLAAIGRKDASELLDEAVGEIADKVSYKNPEIEGNWRRVSVRHLDKVMRAARKWMEASEKVDDASDHTPHNAVMSFARGVAEEVDIVELLVKGLRDERAYPYPLVNALLKRIDSLIRLVAP